MTMTINDPISPAAPAAYADLAGEYKASMEGAAVYDNSYSGRLRAEGADALDLLNRLSTNRVDNLPAGRGAPTILTTDRGRILDLLGVVNIGEYSLLLTGAGKQQAVIDWLDKYTIMEELTVTDITGETAMFTLCGPQCLAALAALMPAAVDGWAEMEPYAAVAATVAGQETLLIRRPLGDLAAWDLVTDAGGGPAVGAALTAAGLVAVGQEAWDALMVSCAIPRSGRELGDAFNPLEAGLIGAVDFAKGCYIGQEVIARLDTYNKVQRYLVQLRFPDDAVVAEGAVLESGGRNVGRVTSLATIPTTGERLALAYIRTAQAQPGARLELAAPGQGYGEVVRLPLLFGDGG